MSVSVPWYGRFRLLIGIYLIGLVVGVREYVVSRNAPPVDMLSDEWTRMSSVVSEVNPGDPDTEFLVSIQALRSGDPEAFVKHMEAALAMGVKHNDILMQSYAQQLLIQGADYRRANFALNEWRRNHPSSAEVIWLPLALPPRDAADSAALRLALSEVPWIADFELVDVELNGHNEVRVNIYFRPPHTVDMREAVAAVSVLGLTPEERSRFRVRCLTMIDCNLEPR
jgi:hypothetical protein